MRYRTLEVESPPLDYYVQRIEQDQPFSLVRYGEGELRIMVRSLPPKRSKHHDYWFSDEGRFLIARTIRECHQDSDYFPALWHLEHMDKHGWLDETLLWLERNSPVRHFHDGGIWRRVVEQGELYPFIEAVGNSRLPILLVGPPWLEKLPGLLGWNVALHVVSPPQDVYFHCRELIDQVSEFQEPAIVLFSVGGVKCIAIHELFQECRDSFLIDCGAMWDVFCGHGKRVFQKQLSRETLRRNLGGRPA